MPCPVRLVQGAGIKRGALSCVYVSFIGSVAKKVYLKVKFV